MLCLRDEEVLWLIEACLEKGGGMCENCPLEANCVALSVEKLKSEE